MRCTRLALLSATESELRTDVRFFKLLVFDGLDE